MHRKSRKLLSLVSVVALVGSGDDDGGQATIGVRITPAQLQFYKNNPNINS